MTESKEEFLRDKMYSLYMFAAKLIITLSSSTLGFSVGLQSLVSENKQFEKMCLLPLGWSFLVLSIVLVIVFIWLGLEVTYKYYNNIVSENPEIDETTQKFEGLCGKAILSSFGSYLIGLALILVFIFINI